MTSKKLTTITGEIKTKLTDQVLGLTDQHIYFFENNVKTLGIHQLMLNDYQALVQHAAKADIEIKIASGFRSFERQLLIWNNKFTGKTAIKDSHGDSIDISQLSDIDIAKAILLFSALPGASRHHWGSDIDIYAPNLLGDTILQLEPWEYAPSGPMAKLSSWLTEYSGEYNFCFPYDSYRGGIAEEPWHLSYIPLAKQYQSVLNVELLKQLLSKTDIAGKDAIIEHLPVIFERYINNINTLN
jgi:LAS superfamily LD-carboxypeptidase LdcB